MRTTLDIDDDVLQAAKELAEVQKTTVGKVISDLARKGLQGDQKEKRKWRNGVPLLPSRGEVITKEHIQKIMDAEGV